MEPLFAIGVWALAWLASRRWFSRRGRPQRSLTLGKMMMEPFISSHRDQFGGCYDENLYRSTRSL